MLTGKRALAADDNASLIAAILTSDPPAIRALNPSVSAALERVVQRCLEGETLMSAKVVCKDTFHVEGQPRELFVNDAGRHFKMQYFSPMPDGRRFVIPRPACDQSLSITLVENWMIK
jgi:hypothetical protein